MRTVADHQAAIRELLAPLRSRPSELVRIDAAPELLGRVLAEDLRTPIDHPPFDNSQMDGYAVASAQIESGRSFTVDHRIAAGSGFGRLAAGRVAPIMTGAPIPGGADAVIPIEAATPNRFPPEDGDHVVTFEAAVDAGTFVRGRGSDLGVGEILLAAGTVLGPSQWAVIAASGITDVPLVRRLRVLVVSTGDELQDAGTPLAPGKIYDANSISMALCVIRAGGVPEVMRSVPDDAAALERTVAASVHLVDVVLTTGGVSRGAYEVVRDVFEPAGVRFGSVAMQPGGPQGWGIATFDGETVPVVAFPGNPVSALVSFQVFLAPVLRELHRLPGRLPQNAVLGEHVTSPEGKHQVRRGRLADDGTVELVGGPSSHLLHGFATSTHLVHIPLGVSSLSAGDTVEIWSNDD